MDWINISRMLESLLLPPGALILLALLALLMARISARGGRIGIATVVLGLYVGSVPLTAGMLAGLLQFYPALSAEQALESGADAIVVLGAGTRRNAPEYGHATVSALGLERLRLAARLAKATGLPVLTSGGQPILDTSSEARRMAAVLQQDLGIDIVWLEERSRNTAENARYSATMLRENNVERVILVSHAIHMPRAVASFRDTGLTVIPAPTGFYRSQLDPLSLRSWLPNPGAAFFIASAVRELVAIAWYRFK